MKLVKLFFTLSIISILISSCGDDSGCTNPNACNYNPNATVDSGDCENGPTWYEDQDGDGLGNPDASIQSCTKPDGFVSDNSDDFDLLVTNRQRASIAYVGATWCPPCGERGGPFLSYIHQTISTSDAVLLSFQTGDLISPSNSEGSKFSIDIFQSTDAPYIPHLFVGGGTYSDMRGLSTTLSTNVSDINQDLEIINAQEARVGLGGTAKLINGKIEVNIALQMFSPENTEYFVSTYLVEDNVITDQTVGTTQNPIVESDVVHDNIVRANMDGTSSFKGMSIGNTFSTNEIVLRDYTITIPNLTSDVPQIDTEHIKLAVVVWSGSGFKMENVIALDIN